MTLPKEKVRRVEEEDWLPDIQDGEPWGGDLPVSGDVYKLYPGLYWRTTWYSELLFVTLLWATDSVLALQVLSISKEGWNPGLNRRRYQVTFHPAIYLDSEAPPDEMLFSEEMFVYTGWGDHWDDLWSLRPATGTEGK